MAISWHQWRIVILCAMGGALQGWVEVVINGAQTCYQPAFQKWTPLPRDSDNKPFLQPSQREDPQIIGLVNSAPYLFAVLSCWFSPLLNRGYGRRGTIFWSTAFSITFSLLQARSQSWEELFIYRMPSGVGIEAKSVTIPLYVAETAPESIKGSLVMCWQVCVALGVMLGNLVGVVFQDAGSFAGTEQCPLDDASILLSWTCSQNWRFMIGSSSLLATFLFLFIYGCYECPRWTIARGHRLNLKKRSKAAKKHFKAA